MKRSIFLVGLLFMMLGLNLGATTTFAQTYPNRPIQLVIPGAAGSILDIAGRLTGDELGKYLGRNSFP